jgi:hypothetical protein
VPAGAGAARGNGEHAQGAEFALCFSSASLVVDTALLDHSGAGTAHITSDVLFDGYAEFEVQVFCEALWIEWMFFRCSRAIPGRLGS